MSGRLTVKTKFWQDYLSNFFNKNFVKATKLKYWFHVFSLTFVTAFDMVFDMAFANRISEQVLSWLGRNKISNQKGNTFLIWRKIDLFAFDLNWRPLIKCIRTRESKKCGTMKRRRNNWFPPNSRNLTSEPSNGHQTQLSRKISAPIWP